MIGRNNIRIFFNGVDFVDVGTGTGHLVFADEEFVGRREVGNNFGVRLGQRNRLPYAFGDGGRCSVDKIFGGGIDGVENFRRGLPVIFGVGSIQICAGGQRNFNGAFGFGNVIGEIVSARRLDERAQPESAVVLFGIPAAIRELNRRRLVVDDNFLGRDVRGASIDNFFCRGDFCRTCKKFDIKQKKFRTCDEFGRRSSFDDNRGGLDIVLIVVPVLSRTLPDNFPLAI